MDLNKWTGCDRRKVAFVALGITIWLVALLWLILDLWLHVAGFWTCLLAAVLFSWAPWRQNTVIVNWEIPPTAH
jgi:hypothetical protein